MPRKTVGAVGDERLLCGQYDDFHVVLIEIIGRPYAEEKPRGEEHRSRGNGKSGVEAAYPEKIVEYNADEGERKGDYEDADVVKDAFDEVHNASRGAILSIALHDARRLRGGLGLCGVAHEFVHIAQPALGQWPQAFAVLLHVGVDNHAKRLRAVLAFELGQLGRLARLRPTDVKLPTSSGQQLA
jgi:hypothetical protein